MSSLKFVEYHQTNIFKLLVYILNSLFVTFFMVYYEKYKNLKLHFNSY